MDLVGQKLAEKLMIWIIVLCAGVGFLAGYILSDFKLMALINAVGLTVTLLVVVPDWPFFNKNPLQWLAPLNPPNAPKPKPWYSIL